MYPDVCLLSGYTNHHNNKYTGVYPASHYRPVCICVPCGCKMSNKLSHSSQSHDGRSSFILFISFVQERWHKFIHWCVTVKQKKQICTCRENAAVNRQCRSMWKLHPCLLAYDLYGYNTGSYNSHNERKNPSVIVDIALMMESLVWTPVSFHDQ